jgi:hypothetical protein
MRNGSGLLNAQQKRGFVKQYCWALMSHLPAGCVLPQYKNKNKTKNKN